ncbi:MAG TPA: HNH endonuclease [Candidatus Hydrogenedentes bacterium]|nr:HNH endonuclease [Candidatus Hydrogenedentota bacterium]
MQTLYTKGHARVGILLDDEDAERLKPHRLYFYPKKSRYPIVRLRNRRTISVHRFVLNLPYRDGKTVDHRNHDPLDNRKANLRICTASLNLLNMRKHSDRPIGVSPDRNAYQTQFSSNNFDLRLRFQDPTLAAIAYDTAKRALGIPELSYNFPTLAGETLATNHGLPRQRCERIAKAYTPLWRIFASQPPYAKRRATWRLHYYTITLDPEAQRLEIRFKARLLGVGGMPNDHDDIAWPHRPDAARWWHIVDKLHAGLRPRRVKNPERNNP